MVLPDRHTCCCGAQETFRVMWLPLRQGIRLRTAQAQARARGGGGLVAQIGTISKSSAVCVHVCMCALTLMALRRLLEIGLLHLPSSDSHPHTKRLLRFCVFESLTEVSKIVCGAVKTARYRPSASYVKLKSPVTCDVWQIVLWDKKGHDLEQNRGEERRGEACWMHMTF